MSRNERQQAGELHSVRALVVLLIVTGVMNWEDRRLPAAEIVVEAGIKHQTIEGFGTCLISWVPRMHQFYQTPEAAKTYAEDLRFNFLRCNLWGEGTIPRREDPSNIRCEDPAFAANDTRTPVFIDFAKAIQQINPNVKVIGTVWSPPAWMKENNAITGTFSGAAGRNLPEQQGRTHQSGQEGVLPSLRKVGSRDGKALRVQRRAALCRQSCQRTAVHTDV